MVNVRSSVGRAVGFLLTRRDRRGWWRDFDTFAGLSDEWVTAYVATALSGANDQRAAVAAQRAWVLLKRRHPWLPGWGYNGLVPADADSTLWVLALASRLGATNSPRARRARTFASRHLQLDGSVATYRDSRAIRLYTRLGGDVSFAGWSSGHTCVSALAAGVLDEADSLRTARYLREMQGADGTWHSYWWCHREYATALAAVALERSSDPADRERIRRAAEGLSGPGPIPAPPLAYAQVDTPFQIALRIRVMVRSPDGVRMRPLVLASLADLMRRQEGDGSWEPSATLRIPPPGVVDPEKYHSWVRGARGGGAVQVDQRACYTTATVLTALAEAETRLE